MPKFELETQKFLDHLKDKWKENPCPMCGHKNWSISGKIFEMREFSGGDFFLGGGPIIPIAPVTCENCGNTVMINALKPNLMKEIPSPKDMSEKEKNA